MFLVQHVVVQIRPDAQRQIGPGTFLVGTAFGTTTFWLEQTGSYISGRIVRSIGIVEEVVW